MLLDWRTLGFSPDELHLLEGAPILVRTGRRSFYSTILSPDRAFLRYDPGCLEAVDERGQAALRLVEHRLTGGSPEVHRWRQGDILVIDNWRVLHGRGPTDQGSGRRLARVLIDA
ncbi:TauD/TfdA family dioxygenase [Mesorhizobium sp. M0243]